MPTLFDHYVIVDWSAENRPKTGHDSIWICHRGPNGELGCANPATRHAAKLLLADILADVAARGERAVLGFDFPFGYPAGFADRLGLAGPPWRMLWDEIASLLHDHDDNRNDRFEVGAALNRRVSGGPFPFWGCPSGKAGKFLGAKKPDGYAPEGLAEKRLIDERMTGAQPCWKLAYPGCVGSQALTGIPVVRALRDHPRWSETAQVWPFETGLSAPKGAQVVFAEVYPSLWKLNSQEKPKDKAQVRDVAQRFADLDRSGAFADLFAGDPNLTDEQRRRVVSEEAWTLGVMAPRAPKSLPLRPRGRRGSG
jgi:precorrin-8X/cobalt-precorrin-8 methylmutase